MGTGVSVAATQCMPRRARVVRALLGSIVLLVGCGGSAQQLRKPIHQKCETAGVSDCAELSSGMVLYLDGDKKQGAARMKHALAASPQPKIDEFASSLEGLASRGSAKPYMEDIRALAARMRGQAGQSGKTSRPAGNPHDTALHEAARTGTGSLAARPTGEKSASSGVEAEVVAVNTPDTDASRITTRTVAPSNHPRMKPCGALYPAGGECVRVGVGPMVVTDLTTSSTCRPFVAIGDSMGDPGAPKWIVHGPFDFHGARLVVSRGNALYVGVGESDPTCSVTWSGFTPYSAPEGNDDQ
jgi:hypothetical protein